MTPPHGHTTRRGALAGVNLAVFLAAVLGRLHAGSPMVAWGPLKNSHPARGIGFVVPLRDSSGRLCRDGMAGKARRMIKSVIGRGMAAVLVAAVAVGWWSVPHSRRDRKSTSPAPAPIAPLDGR